MSFYHYTVIDVKIKQNFKIQLTMKIDSKTLKERGFIRNNLDNEIIWWTRGNYILEEIPKKWSEPGYVLRKKISENGSSYISVVYEWNEVNAWILAIKLNTN